MTFCPIFHGTPEDLSRIYPITYKIGADLTQHFERIEINSRLGVIYKLIQQDGVRTGEDVFPMYLMYPMYHRIDA